MSRRKYNSSEDTVDKNDLFFNWQKAAGGTLNYSPGLKNANYFYHVDLTAGPGIDDRGNRNVLLRSIDAHMVAGVFSRMRYIAFEEDRERYERLCHSLKSEGLLSETEVVKSGKVVVMPGLFGDFHGWLRGLLAGQIGEVCFDPVPDGNSIIDAKLIASIFPENMSISSYVGQTGMARVSGMLAKKQLGSTSDGLSVADWDYESLLRVLRGSRPYAFASRKMGSVGGRVVVFTKANKKPPGMNNLDEGIQRDFFS
jgi:hypothetical protein